MYSALLDVRVLSLNKPVWKQKIPLKVKIFIWLLHRGVILTKDNLAKCNWKGSKQCCFCTNVEIIAHLFFGCHLARLLWRIIFITFSLTKPNNIVQLFGSWLQGFRWEKKNIIFTGLWCALLWSIWLSRNDVVFHNNKKQTALQILFRATYLTRTWAILQKKGQRLDYRCNWCDDPNYPLVYTHLHLMARTGVPQGTDASHTNTNGRPKQGESSGAAPSVRTRPHETKQWPWIPFPDMLSIE